MMFRVFTGALAAAALLAAPALAQDPLAEGVRACAEIEKTRQRLACFDELAESLDVAAPTQAAAAEPVAAPTPEPKPMPAPETSEAAIADTFGADDLVERERVKTVETSARSLDVQIVRVIYTESGKGVFQFSNGQIWIQTEPEDRRRFDSEDLESIEARLERRMFGGYWLKTKSPRRAVRVERRK